MAIGDTLTGTIATRAEQDVFLLTMKNAGAITIGGAGCTANGEVSHRHQPVHQHDGGVQHSHQVMTNLRIDLGAWRDCTW